MMWINLQKSHRQLCRGTVFGLKGSGFLKTMVLMEHKSHIKLKQDPVKSVMAANIPLHFPQRSNQSQRATPSLYQLTSI